MTGWLAFARTAASVLSRPSPVLPNLRNGFLNPSRPIRAGDDQALLTGASIEARLTQAESAFDDIGNVM